MNPGTIAVAHLHPGHVKGYFMTAMVNMLAFDLHNCGGRILNGGGYISLRSGPNIAGARNKVVEQFLRGDAEWLLFLDSDMVPAPDTAERLVQAADPVERPIVGGLCFGAKDDFDGYSEYFPTLYRFTSEGSSLRFQEWPEDDWVKVDGTGAACLLIHRDVLEKIGSENPEPFRWFQEIVVNGRPWSEDMTFCLRAAVAGFPIWVHTGIQVGHVKDRIVTAQTYKRWWETEVTEPEFVVTGSGRSGTGYISHVLSLLGIRTGHEEWWNPFNRRSGSLRGDASWCAVPHLEGYGGKVGLQLRDPLKVMGSLMNGQVFGAGADRESPYYREKAKHVEFTGNDLEDAARYVVEWNDRAEERADVVWRLEDLDGELLASIVETLTGQVVDAEIAGRALEMVPKSQNKHRHTIRLRWDDLPEGGVFDELRGHARRHGYLE